MLKHLLKPVPSTCTVHIPCMLVNLHCFNLGKRRRGGGGGDTDNCHSKMESHQNHRAGLVDPNPPPGAARCRQTRPGGGPRSWGYGGLRGWGEWGSPGSRLWVLLLGLWLAVGMTWARFQLQLEWQVLPEGQHFSVTITGDFLASPQGAVEDQRLHWAGALLLQVIESVSHSVVSNSLWPPWTVAHQAPLSMGFCRQEHWSELPGPSPGDLPDPGSPALLADSLPSEPPRKP